MILKKLAIVGLAICFSLCSAQQILSNDTILKMHAAGLGDDLIISTINGQPGTYATTANDLIVLKGAGISDKVIASMMSKRNSPEKLVQAQPPVSIAAPPTINAEKPRIFLQSASHGSNQNASRDQSMEMSKDFERDCPGVRVSINQQMADYTVALNHIEVGLFIRDNQIQIADKNGDLISKTKEGGSIAGAVKKACQFILTDWTNRSSQAQRQ